MDDFQTQDNSIVIFDRHQEQVLIQVYTPYSPCEEEADVEDGNASVSGD